jgi:hypothetical protein
VAHTSSTSRPASRATRTRSNFESFIRMSSTGADHSAPELYQAIVGDALSSWTEGSRPPEQPIELLDEGRDSAASATPLDGAGRPNVFEKR